MGDLARRRYPAADRGQAGALASAGALFGSAVNRVGEDRKMMSVIMTA